ncbi:DNA pilot protein [Blackfly microvirus SF02]|uniref:DNA pilot protein n=1 Tax=Blackfly microvirus SF02 TaxID=2576452 RepID=A0A4P8PJK4_9VIRU|nr:DNA pilot protein [Blackfly microvirus SF02]
MFGIDDAILAAGVSGISSMVTGGMNQSNTAATNATNMQIAQENRAWQEHMSNTAHTREVADLRNAGLNPILSATGGSGASTPSGSIATMQPKQMPTDIVKGAVDTALAVRSNLADVKLKEATTNKVAADTITSLEEPARVRAETRRSTAAGTESNTRSNLNDQAWYIRRPDVVRANSDTGALNNTAGDIIRKTGTLVQEGNRIAVPFLNSAESLMRMKGRGPRRSTTETSTEKFEGGSNTFSERFDY